MHTIQNIIKDTSPSQEHPQSSSTPKKTPEMSSIFERVLDAFNLNRFQPNFKQGFLRAYADHPKHHQGNQPQSGTSTIIINCSKNTRIETIQNVAKDTRPSQEHPQSSSTLTSTEPFG